MAHNLWIENGKAHMMFAGQLPWHGLGTQLSGPATSAEAIEAAGLDWRVRKVPLYAIEGPGIAHVPKYYGVVPEDRWGKPDCPVFGIVSEDYHPLQNSEAFEFFDSIVGKKVAMYHTAGALGKGEQVWILAKLPGMMDITSSDGAEKYVLLSTGHDGRTCVRVILTPVRVVCQNTLTLALQSGEEIARAYHTRNMARQLASAKKKVQTLLKGFDTMHAAFQAMAKHKMTETTAKAYVDRVFPVPADLADRKVPDWILQDRANCVHLYHNGKGNDDAGSRETLWAAYNGITEYVDHWRDRGDRQHMYAVCFGRGFQIKNRAYQQARTMISPITVN
jgi:phage/plasmid-like protein (TIGR03299 family)